MPRDHSPIGPKLRALCAERQLDIDQLEKQIVEIADDYEYNKIIEELSGRPKAQKKTVAKLIGHLTQASVDLSDLSPDIVVAIGAIAEEVDDAGSAIGIVDFIDKLRQVRDAGEEFLRRYEPPAFRPANVALEEAVRALLDLVEANLGLAVEVTLSKPDGNAGRANSPGAELIFEVLQALDASVTSTAIVNMIKRVRSEPKQKPTPLDYVMETYVDELDLALRSDKRD